MRLLVAGVEVDTTEYLENGSIHFTVFTHGGHGEWALGAVLDTPNAVIPLERGGEMLTVRVLDHWVWPPASRRFGDMVRRHEVSLESVHPSALGPGLTLD